MTITPTLTVTPTITVTPTLTITPTVTETVTPTVTPPIPVNLILTSCCDVNQYKYVTVDDGVYDIYDTNLTTNIFGCCYHLTDIGGNGSDGYYSGTTLFEFNTCQECLSENPGLYVNVSVTACCNENPPVSKIDVGIGCSLEFTLPTVGQVINYFGFCYEITAVSDTIEGCAPAYQYYNVCSDCQVCATPTPTPTVTITRTPTHTPTITPTDSGTAPSELSSVYYDTPMNFGSDLSYLRSGFEPSLRTASGRFTFSTWIQPNWIGGGATFAPASFMEMRAPSLGSGCGADSTDFINFSYDSESAQDSLFVVVGWCQGDDYKSHTFTAEVADGPNGTITGIPPQPTTSWNNTTSPQFVNITFTIDGNALFAPVGTSSNVGTFYWNGTALDTLDGSPPTGSTTSYLTAFSSGSTINLGGFQWPQAHWQDQTLFVPDLVHPSDIATIIYSGGTLNADLTPSFPSSVMFNYNGSGTSWKDSTNGSITLTQVVVGTINLPIQDTNNYVA